MTVAFVKGAINADSNTSATSVSVTLASTVGVGNALCGCVKTDNPNALTITDDKSNVYLLGDNIIRADSLRQGQSFYLTNITNAPRTITVSWPTASTTYRLVVDEFSGVATTSALDAHHGQDQTSVSTSTDAISSGVATTTLDGDLLWVATIQKAVGSSNSAVAAGTGFTFTEAGNQATDPNPMSAEWRAQNVHGAVSGTFTATTVANNEFMTLMLCLKAQVVVVPPLFIPPRKRFRFIRDIRIFRYGMASGGAAFPQPIDIIVNPMAPTIPDTTPLGATVATYSVVMSDGSAYRGTVTFGPPNFDAGGIFALNTVNKTIIVNPAGPGVGPNMSTIVDHITLQAL
jgi:hypothetical protein